MKFGEEWAGWTSKMGRGVYSCAVVVCGEVFKWVGRHLAKTLCLRFGWGTG